MNEEQLKAMELARRIKKDRVFLNNPVVMQGLGLAPLVVAAVNLQNAVMLAVAVLLILTPTRVLAAFFDAFFAVSLSRADVCAFRLCRIHWGAVCTAKLIYPGAAGTARPLPALAVCGPDCAQALRTPAARTCKNCLEKGLDYQRGIYSNSVFDCGNS